MARYVDKRFKRTGFKGTKRKNFVSVGVCSSKKMCDCGRIKIATTQRKCFLCIADDIKKR